MRTHPDPRGRRRWCGLFMAGDKLWIVKVIRPFRGETGEPKPGQALNRADEHPQRRLSNNYHSSSGGLRERVQMEVPNTSLYHFLFRSCNSSEAAGVLDLNWKQMFAFPECIFHVESNIYHLSFFANLAETRNRLHQYLMAGDQAADKGWQATWNPFRKH